MLNWITRSRWPLLALLITVLSGCATRVINAQRTPAFTGAVSTASLVVAANTMESHSAAPTLGVVLGFGGAHALSTTGSALTRDAQAMGEQVVRQLPAALQAAGLALSGPPVFTTTYPTTPHDLSSLLPPDAKAPVLMIKPVGARMECPGSCFAFMVMARLLAADRQTVLWSAYLQMPPKASNFADFSAPVGTFTEALVGQMKRDGVLR